MNRSDGDDDSGLSKRRRALGLNPLSRRFSYSGLNMIYDFIVIFRGWRIVDELRSYVFVVVFCIVGSRYRKKF